MRILHVFDHSVPLHSGYTFRSRNILLHQRQLGWETVHVTGLKQGDCADSHEVVEDLSFYRTVQYKQWLAKLPLSNQWQVVTTLRDRISEIIAIEKPDIIQAHSPALNGLAALKAGRKAGIPVVYECRAFWEDAAVDHGTSAENGLRYRLTRAMETHVFKQADAVTTICEGLRQDIASRGVSADKITVIPNAVDATQFSYGVPADKGLQEQLGLEGKTVIGFIGSFYAYEGIPLLLEAIASMVKSVPNVALLLVGGGPEEALVKQKIEQYNLKKHVVMTGRVPHHDVQQYYNLVDIFAYPRLPMRLTELVTPLKPLEAMAQGRLVVASDVGGHRELIKHGLNGRLFEAGSSEALASSLLELMQEKQLWADMRKAGRDYVENERNWVNSIARYKAVFSGLLPANQKALKGS